MARGQNMYMKIAVTLFAAYFLNVFLGAVTSKPVLNDIFEMLVLVVSTLFFVLAILKLEAKSKEKIT
jgi:hypothetical protein